MATKYEKQSIDRFTFISEENSKKLRKNNVKTLGQLSKKNRSDLKKLGFENYEINRIDLELQLLGLGIKNKN